MNSQLKQNQTIRLALAQMLVEPGEPDRNLTRAEERIEQAAAGGAGIVLLPEALDCGWTHPSAIELAEAIPGGAACERLRAAARLHRIMVCAGIIERNGERLFNSAILVANNGDIQLHHRKLNELDFARALYALGDRLGVAETSFGRIGLLICADAFVDGLVVSRTLGQMGATLILSPCAWAVPPDFNEPYGQLWRDSYGPPARKFQMTIAGCSNIGPVTAGQWNGWQCIGASLVIDRNGEQLLQGGFGTEELLFIDL